MPFQQTQNICITFLQRQPSVFDVGPTLYKGYTNVLCLLGSMANDRVTADAIILENVITPVITWILHIPQIHRR